MIMISGHSQTVTIDENAICHLEELLHRLEVKRLFFVIDKPAYEFSGARKVLQSILKDYEVSWFSEFELNPKIEDVERGIDLFREVKPNVVLALGGGSALDMAKLISICSSQKGNVRDYVIGNQELVSPICSMIAIPTTSGTGSEATHFAVIYVDGQKYSLAHQHMLPNYVIIDPILTYSLPPRATAASGLDALCQSIESIWAVGANVESIKYASEALPLALEHIEVAVCNPNPAARMAMARAAYLAGKAINISKTTAPHAFSYGITTCFGVPHGFAVALTLPLFFEFNYKVGNTNCNDSRGVTSVKSRINYILELFDAGTIQDAQFRIKKIMQNIECPIRLGAVGIKESDINGLIQMVNLERLSNNPRKITNNEMNDMLMNIL